MKFKPDPKLVLVTNAGCNLGLYVISNIVKEGHRIRALIKNIQEIQYIQIAAQDSNYPIEILSGDIELEFFKQVE